MNDGNNFLHACHVYLKSPQDNKWHLRYIGYTPSRAIEVYEEHRRNGDVVRLYPRSLVETRLMPLVAPNNDAVVSRTITTHGRTKFPARKK